MLRNLTKRGYVLSRNEVNLYDCLHIRCNYIGRRSFSKLLDKSNIIGKYKTAQWPPVRQTSAWTRRAFPTTRNNRPMSTSISGKHDTEIGEKNQQNGKFQSGPDLAYFITQDLNQSELGVIEEPLKDEPIPYLLEDTSNGVKRKVFFETYGCQMNVNDTEIAWSILQKNNFVKASNIEESDVALIMTCSIREGAETKIWNRLEYLKFLKRRRHQFKKLPPFKIGILGCMAERLKHKLVEQEKQVDVVCGPDAYRDLPRMLAVTETGQAAVNVLLSLDETYADVMPVRINQGGCSAFVSIMRGCDNMCTYCIVPFTRGRERSRPMESILDEIRALSDQGIKDVTLLGQNVNSYRDTSQLQSHVGVSIHEPTKLSKGFKTIYKPKKGGFRFSDLLDKASLIDPDVRIRFTSPHPKDFPDEVLHLIRDRSNICKQLHMPAQSGSNTVLERMRRGYTREAYLELIENTKRIIPNVSLSSDFIAGFCEETEEDHKETLDLMRRVQYNFAFCFPYSLRQKTHAYHRLKDNVPDDVKSRRHHELIEVFREGALALNRAQVGQHHLVLVEGASKRSEMHLAGRNEGNIKVIFPHSELSQQYRTSSSPVQPGDYIAVEITDCSSQVLKGKPLYQTSVQEFYSGQNSDKLHSSLSMQSSMIHE